MNSIEQAENWVRRALCLAPSLVTPDGRVEVLLVDSIPQNATYSRRTVVVDLDDGTTVRLDIQRYPTE